METLDYIFYSATSLVPVSLLELPTEEETKNQYTGMPNPQWSSDHIALLAEFQYRKRNPLPPTTPIPASAASQIPPPSRAPFTTFGVENM